MNLYFFCLPFGNIFENVCFVYFHPSYLERWFLFRTPLKIPVYNYSGIIVTTRFLFTNSPRRVSKLILTLFVWLKILKN